MKSGQRYLLHCCTAVPSLLGSESGKIQPEEVYKHSEHGGVKKDGTEDSCTNPEHGFGGERAAASEAGRRVATTDSLLLRVFHPASLLICPKAVFYVHGGLRLYCKA